MPLFVLFGLHHLAALILVAFASVLAFRAGAGRYSDRFNVVGGTLLLLYGLGLWAVKLSDGFHRLDDLPLQLCDITFILCILCFFRPNAIALTLVTYWGLGGTLQALLTPDVVSGFPSKEFCLFFLGHGAIVAAVAFLIGRLPHPEMSGWKGIRTAFFGLLCYTFLVGTVDFIFQLNYGYLRTKPTGASILDYLGPWPYYVFATLAVALCIFSLISLGLTLLQLPAAGGDRHSFDEGRAGEGKPGTRSLS